ncbi:DUF2723 domain-containing protein [Niabella digestorum]|uniref:DUF2723 domain-containing protein n=1 Tax=Niabella digestorum TaxID=3117701 RepID=A0ABU7REC9_9BACT
MNFRKVNNITGWIVFVIATLTYVFTREARGSLWDCGEFVACAFKLGMPHPPGAPMFTLLGRFFIILFGDNAMTAANAVNFMSALASSGTILFLFWTITHFARKMYVNVGEELSPAQLITVMGAGVIGALAYTFTDSFWYSAVEGEVYALSSLFTALVFWLILKWEHADERATNEMERAKSDRWIIFLFFMMGLSIGVHLLNLLTIPAIVMIYYYRRYKATNRGALIAFLVGCAITGIVQVAVIQYSMKAAGLFDVFFVNKFGLPFFSGFAIYFVVLAALIVWGLRFKNNVSKTSLLIWAALFFTMAFLPFAFSSTGAAFKIILLLAIGGVLGYFIKPATLGILKLLLWCYAFMMLGYSMYFTSMIRSNADPAIDMNNVDNPINLVYYLSREQYGSAPLIYGPHYAAEVERDAVGYPVIKYKEMQYSKGKDKYIPIGRRREYVYQKSDMQLFPRVWDPSNAQGHAQFYADWLNLDQQRDEQTGQIHYGAPSYADNINWFLSYQTDFLFMRYFMWNFAGRQNDLQGFGNKRDGNWISGISLIDSPRLGDQSKLPDSLKNNKGHNKLYMLPFVLGILGFVYQLLKNRRDFIVTLIFFFFMGEALVIYLNAPGNMPRERDYVFVGACYVFTIWIGLSVLAFVRMAVEKLEKDLFKKILTYGATLAFLVTLISSLTATFKGTITASIFAALWFVLVVIAITLIVRALSAKGTNLKTAGIVASVICLFVPALMAQQEWDDHDRSQKTLAPDLAKDYLESCAPNAILFTFGDNDTYPLWYAQEVEGIRKDIRIINTSLLGIDWYINQLRYKINDADSVDVIWSPEQIQGHNREYIRIGNQGGDKLDPNAYYPLYDVMKDYLGQSVTDEDGNDVGPGIMPFRKFFVPVDKEVVRKNGTANPTDSIADQIQFDIPASALTRNDLIMLNIIATNKWQRPIYFTAAYGDLGFGHYLRKDGLTYRLVPFPVKTPQQNWVTDQAMRSMRAGGTSVRDNNLEVIFNNLHKKFEFGGANKKGVYFDEVNRQYLLNIRAIFAEAAGNLADAGRKEEAIKLLEKEAQNILPENLPYGMTSRYSMHNQTGILLVEAHYKAGMFDRARQIAEAVRKDIVDQRAYYEYLKNNKPEYYSGLEYTEVILNEIMDEVLKQVEQTYDPTKKAAQQIPEINPQEAQQAADSAQKATQEATK